MKKRLLVRLSGDQRVVQRELAIEWEVAAPKQFGMADADMEQTLVEVLTAQISKQVVEEIPTLVRELLTQSPSLREAETAVLEAARDLRDSGYDGPFIGEVCYPLFTALAELERAQQKEQLRQKAQAKITEQQLALVDRLLDRSADEASQRGLTPSKSEALSPVYCEHANEMPGRCPCPVDCYCKSHSCRSR